MTEFPDEAASSAIFSILRSEIDQFAQFSGDTNPIHSDSTVAYNLGFEDVVSHGMLSALKVLHIYPPALEHVEYFGVNIRFWQPIYPERPWRIEFDAVNMALTVVSTDIRAARYLEIRLTNSPFSQGRTPISDGGSGFPYLLGQNPFARAIVDHMASISRHAGNIKPGPRSLLGRVYLEVYRSELPTSAEIKAISSRRVGLHEQVEFSTPLGKGSYHSLHFPEKGIN